MFAGLGKRLLFIINTMPLLYINCHLKISCQSKIVYFFMNPPHPSLKVGAFRFAIVHSSICLSEKIVTKGGKKGHLCPVDTFL